MAPRVHFHQVEEPQPCAYLPGRLAQHEHQVMTEVDLDALEQLLVRGWRRFGPLYFRPVCIPCGECRPLRIPVGQFRPTPSQLRALRRSRRFQLTFGRPRVDEARLALYRKWHAAREQVRGWEASALDARGYFEQFAFPHPAVHELALHDGDRLVAIGIWDVTPNAMSAVYCFFDPDLGRLSPGVANVMLGLELARARNVPHVYLGYRVLECPSLRYKGAFWPHELLSNRPSADQAPRWLPGGS
jgi:arginyl-tRNA--protein-N-Asp/Glu arginylyltransferase